MSKAIIVTGATGNQGGALIQALVDADANLEIIAISRDPSSKSATRLASKSNKIKVISGNLDKPDNIFENAKKVATLPIWGVYSVQTVSMSLNPWDDTEVRQGKALVDAALRNNIEMFVYSSVERGGDASYDNATYVPHFKTKYEIEHHLVDSSKNTGMSYTILRPVAFMNNFQGGFFGQAFATIWSMSLGNKLGLQLIAASDIGYFGAQAFLHPDEYKDRSLSLAGDELSYEQLEQVFRDKTGEPLPTTYRAICWFLLLLSHDMSLMMKWFKNEQYGANIQQLRKIHPGLKTFADWLETESPYMKRR